MHSSPPSPGPPGSDPTTALPAAPALLVSARALQASARAGQTQALLRGKNLALLCADAGSADALLFRRAGSALGARVAQVRPEFSTLSDETQVQHTARLFGRLYDAVECQGLERALVARIAAAAGVPVYDGLANLARIGAGLDDPSGQDPGAEETGFFMLQAALLASLA